MPNRWNKLEKHFSSKSSMETTFLGVRRGESTSPTLFFMGNWDIFFHFTVEIFPLTSKIFLQRVSHISLVFSSHKIVWTIYKYAAIFPKLKKKKTSTADPWKHGFKLCGSTCMKMFFNEHILIQLVQSLSYVRLCNPMDCSTSLSPTPEAYTNSYPSSQWCHLTI